MPEQTSTTATIAQLLAALRVALPVIDSQGSQWQSDEIRAAIAAGECHAAGGEVSHG